MGLKEDVKLQNERLRVENDIANAVERQTKSMASYREGTKEVKENAKVIKRLDTEILKIQEGIVKALADKDNLDVEGIKLAKQQLANLKQQRAQVVATNKELVSTGNLMKAMGNTMVTAFKGLLPSLTEVINKALELDDITRQTAANLGMSGTAFKTMKNATEEARQSAIEFNQPLDSAVKAVSSYANETGRLVQLNKGNFAAMMGVAQATGMATEDVAQMAGQMEAFGLGANQSASMIMDIQAMSERMGVNSGNVIKKFQQNLGLLNKMNFKGGMKALAKMAAQSEKFKLSMESIAGVSEKVFRPEGAIEAAAQLQMMGGSLAQLGDPFQLMYKARNAPEELQKSIAKAAASSATFNKETGEFELSAHELDRLREASSALGLNLEEMAAAAKQTAKTNMFEGMLGNMSPEDKATIGGMAQMSKDGFAEITLADGKSVKRLQDLSKQDKKLLLDKAKNDKERQDQSKSLLKQWNSFQAGLMAFGIEVIEPLVESLGGGDGILDMLKGALIGFVQTIRSFMSDTWPTVKKVLTEVYKTFTWFGGIMWSAVKSLYGILGPGGTALAILGGKLLFNVAKWVLNGLALSKGFSMGQKMMGGIGTGGGGGAPDMTKAAGSGKMMAGVGSAVTIIAVAAALWILADALIKFNDVEWASLAKGGVALAGLTIGLKAMQPTLTSFSNPTNFVGVAVLLALGAAMLMVGQSAMLMASGGTTGLIGMSIALIGMVAVISALGGLAASGIGFLGVALLLGIGAAMLMVGAAAYLIGAGISLVVTSLTEMFSVLSLDKIGGLFLLGPALVMASLGIIALAGSIFIMGLALANPFGLLGLMGLAVAAYSLGDAMKGVDAGGISKAVDAVNSVNIANIEALKELSMWLGMASGTIKIEFGNINVDGEIDLVGAGGKKVGMELLENSNFTNGIKRIVAEHTYTDKKGY